MIPVVVRPRAQADAEEARAWYDNEKDRLGRRFVREFSRIVDRIAEFPDQFPDVGRGVRRALLHGFPYATYYVRRQDVAIVIAVLHLHRRPDRWRPRARLEEAG